ncbi:hypothetical protein TWF696_003277 [Orbilia brochopaga]|uniref:Uncharacterized protein n=1 Tax=Orbilia brochopaga TaxID=3140254 RepID=A0AAV9TYC5_9PEZI
MDTDAESVRTFYSARTQQTNEGGERPRPVPQLTVHHRPRARASSLPTRLGTPEAGSTGATRRASTSPAAPKPSHQAAVREPPLAPRNRPPPASWGKTDPTSK